MFKVSKKVKILAENSGWIIGQNIYLMLLGVFVTAVVARYFGPAQFGLFNYALSIVFLFTAFSTLSMESFTVKSLLENRTGEGTILFTSLALRLVGGLVQTALAMATIAILSGGDRALMLLGLIFSMSATLKAFDVFDFWAQAHLKMKRVAWIRMSSFTLVAGLKLLVVYFEGSLFAYAFVFVIDSSVAGIALLASYINTRQEKSPWRISLTFANQILMACWPIALSGLFVAVYMRVGQVMLGAMVPDKAEVGIYAAAIRVAEMWFFVPMAMIASFRTVIMQYKASLQHEKYLASIRGLYAITFWIGIAFGVIIAATSGLIVRVLYGPEFAGTAPVLVIAVWAGTFAVLGSARSVWLVSENLEIYTVHYAIAGTLVNVVLNLLLIPHYGAAGAAVATLSSQIVNIFVLLLFPRTRSHTLLLLQSLSPMYIYKAIKERIYIKQTD